METRENLPHNIMEVFHEDVVHEVEPRVEIITINVETKAVGIIYRPMEFTLDKIEGDKLSSPVPYTRIEVPIIDNDTISPTDVSKATNLFFSGITMTDIKAYVDSLDDNEDYMVIEVGTKSPIEEFLESLLGSILD